jgi:hypothetical protein
MRAIELASAAPCSLRIGCRHMSMPAAAADLIAALKS